MNTSKYEYIEQELSVLEFISQFKNDPNGWEIDTPDGWQGVSAFFEKGKKQIIHFETESFSTDISEKHLFQRSTGEWDFAENFEIGDAILTVNGTEKVIHNTSTKVMEDVFDITVDHKNHRYYSDGIVSHNSGGGKSLNMMNLSYNLMEQGLHGVYISIEMKDTKVALRADQMIARMRTGMIKQSTTKVAHEIQLFGERTGARFFIKRMREGVTNANHVSAYLKELEATKAFKPDFVVVDYLDIMQPIRKVTGENMFLKDQYVTEEVRGIGFDYDCIMITGTQLAKSATEMIEEGKTMTQSNTQGGASKTNTSDVMIATVRSKAMKEQGLFRFEFIKSRNSDAVGKSCEMKFNSESLRVTDGSTPALELKKKRPGLQMSDVKPGQAKLTLGGLAGDSST